MLRLLALLTLVTAGGLLVLIAGGQDGVDAHVDRRETSSARQEKSAPPAPVGAATAVVAPAPPKPAQDKLATAGPTSTTTPSSGERTFLMRPTRPTSTEGSPQTVAQAGSPAELRSPVPKTVVERAPTTPPLQEPAPARARLAAVEGPVTRAPASGNGGRFDLNTASVDELNRLGGGMIGKAIVRGRPYASPEDLLRKRVVSRATFDRIRAQLAVQ